MKAIVTDRLTFAYSGGSPTLSDVSLAIDPGERVGLIGPNGAGKTTLFLVLAGVLRVPKSVVKIADLDPADAAQNKLMPTELGMAFQNPDDQILHPVVKEDVAFGPLNLGLSADEARLRVDASLAQVGLSHRADDVPWKLSVGEKRRVALAGVLAMKPDILLLDEPTSGLDPQGRKSLADLLRTLPATLLIASHDLAFVKSLCNRVILLDAGKVIADGPAAEVLSNAELLHKHGLDDSL